VQLADGTQFSVGTGFSDSQRESPPPVGSTITFRYQELSDRGVPRFPSFVRAAAAAPTSAPAVMPSAPPPAKAKGKATMSSDSSSAAGGTRRFEFVEGKSSKFWEITVSGNDVIVHFGRIGTNGQTKTKTFGDPAAAQGHADELIEEKTGKGYVEK
jgi:DNA ligase-1